MKSYTSIKNLKDHIGTEVIIRGFVHTHRDQNKIVFINLRDLSGIIQCVALNDMQDFETCKQASLESVLEIKGFVKEEKQAPDGYEIQVLACEMLSHADPELPIPVNIKSGDDSNAPVRLDHRWLDLRKPEKADIFKLWTALEAGWREYLTKEGYIQIYTPSFMSTPSESGAEVFEVDYFERKAYLAQSPQFYKQMGIASGFEKVFMTGPVFRAELSFTTRHLTEFTGWDFEIAYVESHHDVMDAEEGMLKSAFSYAKNLHPELDFEVPTQPFARIPIKEAKEKLAKAGVKSTEEHDLSPDEEREICKIIKQETGSDFVFITDYHISKRPFYHMRHTEDPEITKSADLLYRGIEVTTLAQREHRPDILITQAKEKSMDIDSLQDYLNFFKYGCPPHGGGGIGPARLIMYMLNLPNVREATYLPRDVKRLKP